MLVADLVDRQEAVEVEGVAAVFTEALDGSGHMGEEIGVDGRTQRIASFRCSRANVGLRSRSDGKLFSACSISRRSEEHTSELQSLMRISYAVFCLTKKN